MLRFLKATLDTEIAPMIYITMFVSVFIGFCFMTGIWVGGSESILYTTGVLVHKQSWGAFLFVTASAAELGFITKRKSLMILGGISGFMVWTFACISLIMNGYWYILITVGLFQMLFHGYVYLAASLDYIRRESKYTD